MKIPSRQAQKFRDYEHSLTNKDFSYNDRLYAFYLLMLPITEWCREFYKDLGFSKYETETELYLVIDNLFRSFDRSKSSIVPYIRKAFIWYLSSSIEKIKSYKEVPVGFNIKDQSYNICENDFYFSAPNILLYDSFIKKHFTRSEKYIIYKIIISEENELSERKLSKKLNISRETFRTKTKEIKEKLIHGGYNGSRNY